MDNILFEVRAVFEAIWRRRWHALIVAWVLCIGGWITVATLPDKYQSTARIYVDTDTLLGPLLQGIAVSTDLASEVAVMQRTLLSRPNLQQTARATDLDLRATTPGEMEKLLDGLASNTQIRSEGQKLYTVSYANSDPKLAKSVVQALLTIFVEGNLGQSRADLEGARAFIARQIVEYETELKSAEQRLAQFKAQNVGILGGGDFSGRLEGARTTLSNAQFNLEEAISRRDSLKRELVTTDKVIDLNSGPQIVINDDTPDSPLALRVQEMEKLLDSQLMRYTEKHPSVLATQSRLDSLQQQLEEEKAEAAAAEEAAGPDAARAASQVPNPLYEQIKLRLVDAENEVGSLQRQVQRAQQKVDELRQLAERAPLVEAEAVNLTRDYNVLKQKYEDLLGRRESARISQAAEATTDAVNFRIIEPPHVPSLPSSPNRPLFIAIVLIAGLGAGVGLSVMLDKLESSYRTPERLTEAFGFPVLGSVSIIVSPTDQRRRLASNIVFGMVCGSLLAIFAIVMLISMRVIGIPDFLLSQGAGGAGGVIDNLRGVASDLPGFIERVVARIQELIGGAGN